MTATKALYAGLLLSGIACGASAAPYLVTDRWPVGGDGGWDLLTVDSDAHLLYLSRATHVTVVDTATGRPVGEIPDTPGVHGIALAPDLNRGFVSAGKANAVKIFDLRTRRVLGTVAVGAKPDAILYEPQARRTVVFNGHSDSATVIDATDGRLVGTIALGGDPELARTDGAGHVYVNLENRSQLAAVDIARLKVSARWALPGCEGPTGLALDAQHHRSFSACANAVLAILDTVSGRPIATLPIGKGVDGAAFDPGTQDVFAPSGEGTLTVVHEIDPDHFAVTQTLATARGARTIALDARAHRLYLPTARFGSAPAGHRKPPVLPGSFVVLVVAARGS